MLGRAKRLVTPSGRSAVPAFMVMDVMAAAARIEAAGGHVVHMEVGQPAAPAPAIAIAAAQAALTVGRLDYTEALGMPSLRAPAPAAGAAIASCMPRAAESARGSGSAACAGASEAVRVGIDGVGRLMRGIGRASTAAAIARCAVEPDIPRR